MEIAPAGPGASSFYFAPIAQTSEGSSRWHLPQEWATLAIELCKLKQTQDDKEKSENTVLSSWDILAHLPLADGGRFRLSRVTVSP